MGLRVRRGERLLDKELSLEAGARRGGIRGSKGEGEAKAWLASEEEKSTAVPPER